MHRRKNIVRGVLSAFLVLFSLSYLSANTLEEIKFRKELKVGVWANNPPFSSIENNTSFGFEIKIAQKIANELLGNDSKVIFIQIENNDDRIRMLENNDVDLIIATFIKTPEREKLVDFSLPYFSITQSALVPKDSEIADPKDFLGKKIIAIDGSSIINFIREKKPSDIIFAKTNKEGFDFLKDLKGDVYVNNSIVIINCLKKDNNYTMPANLTNLGKAEYFAIGIQKGNDNLKKEVDKAIIKLSKSGFFKEAYDETVAPIYKGLLDPKNVLVDDMYKFFG